MRRRKTITPNKIIAILIVILSITLTIISITGHHDTTNTSSIHIKKSSYTESAKTLHYNGNPYVKYNDNQPQFTDSERNRAKKSFESYSDLDILGRCGTATASIGIDIMPTEERGSIGQIKPAGWHTIKYDWIDGKYLYNRCHLIGYQLSGENANERNLITGTRYLNIEGMLDFENQIADYVKKTKNHVLYRVTPVYTDTNLIADGLLLEAESIEDNGKGISFNIYAFNVQPGVEINYKTGESKPFNNGDFQCNIIKFLI